MFQLVSEKGIRPWVQEIPMKDANKAIVDMDHRPQEDQPAQKIHRSSADPGSH
jgi:D-arabinose 1-dehydrogenase-like Zn-dependent alcohol dehydrogenase